jgi:hypothetical protein
MCASNASSSRNLQQGAHARVGSSQGAASASDELEPGIFLRAEPAVRTRHKRQTCSRQSRPRRRPRAGCGATGHRARCRAPETRRLKRQGDAQRVSPGACQPDGERTGSGSTEEWKTNPSGSKPCRPCALAWHGAEREDDARVEGSQANGLPADVLPPFKVSRTHHCEPDEGALAAAGRLALAFARRCRPRGRAKRGRRRR